MKELYLPAVQGWGAALTEGKDPYQVGHAQRVAEYASKLAREVGVGGWDLTYLRIGALIHELPSADNDALLPIPSRGPVPDRCIGGEGAATGTQTARPAATPV